MIYDESVVKMKTRVTEIMSEPSRTRAEHLELCKAAALKSLANGGKYEALTSMASDLSKHPETQNHPGLSLMLQLTIRGLLTEEEEIKKFIEGFN